MLLAACCAGLAFNASAEGVDVATHAVEHAHPAYEGFYYGAGIYAEKLGLKGDYIATNGRSGTLFNRETTTLGGTILVGFGKKMPSNQFYAGIEVGYDFGSNSNMTEMEELVLHATNSNYCSASDLSVFSHMTKLQRLSISVDGLTSLTGLEPLHELLEIELYSQDSSCATLQPLAGLENLQSVTISLVGTRSLDISALGRLPNLQSAHVGPERAISDKSPVDHVYNVSFFN